MTVADDLRAAKALIIGHEYYTDTGQKVELLADLDDRYLVSPVISFDTYDGQEYGRGSPVFVDRLLNHAPREEIDADIARLIAERNALEDKNHELRRQTLEAAKDNAARLRALEKYNGLDRIEDFIEGRITHVMIEAYDGIEVGPISLLAEKKSDADHRKPDGLRLVSLFGNTNGSLTWRVNEYRDGSGSGWRLIVPAASLEEAENHRREFVRQKMDEALAGYVSGRHYHVLSSVGLAIKYGVIVPPALWEIYCKEKAGADRKSADALRKEIAEKKARLDILDRAISAAESAS